MIKRTFDISVSVSLLFFLSPLLVYIQWKVRKEMGTPALFCQKRPGLRGQLFSMVKFRTMRNAFDEQGNLLPDSERLTSFGQFLRSSSLDELPELWNVLKGEMTLVGPRPLLMEYLPLYSSEQNRRHDMKPGITGWAQINGRNSLSWEEKFKLDVWYVDHHSLWLDIKILLMTVKKVFIRDGISAEGHVTMEKFTGNNQ